MRDEGSRLQQEIRQKRPFASSAEEAALALLKTADTVRRLISAVVEPHGITLQQYNVLRILRGAGSEGLPTLEIASRMIEQAPGITRLIDRLEAKGLVERRRGGKDRRQVLCGVTREGLELLAGLDEPVKAADEHAMNGVPENDLVTLIRLLDRVRSGPV
ncbi:MAG: hypothetical protein DIJKHBIC_01056 [Thermoanaerobaculia bacterium]|nr:hypothetical protein [Thermoanaerobaculia bacterium]